MATVRSGKQGVLLVVDAQNGVIGAAWEARRVVDNIERAVDRARSHSVPVIWIQHVDDEALTAGSRAWQLAPPLAAASGEPVILKRYNSSFEETSLDEALAKAGATHIVLAGAATNWCVRATAYGALDRGYDLTLIGDAHTTHGMTLDDGTTVEADRIVAELNAVMAWLSYPGRRSRTASAETVDFGAISGAA